MINHYVAINYITCNEDFKERFEELFGSRAHAIDTMPGFVNMHVLRPEKPGDAYLIVSYWESEQSFRDWMKSPAFTAGHQRGFEELAKAKAEGRPAPMSSDFKIYRIISE